MNKKLNKSILLSVLALSVVTGCSQAPAEQETASSPKSADEAGKGPTKISIMINLHNPEVPSDLIEKLLEEKTNTQLDIQWVPDGTYNDKLNVAFSTGALPQAVY